ncbi:MAG: Gfo/Idh/MocA family oxidoreductase [Chloroflexi bacterium]|nr:Gfo/Idh/MocA family oxidoreductase [Chloroflexota bacterium]
MADQRVKLGIFGYGFIAGVHADALRHIDGVEVVAVCGPRIEAAREFARKHEIAQATTEPDELLSHDDITGVLVDSPDATHHDLVLRSLSAGKHIFCEKPLARTVDEAREMYAAAVKANRRTVVGYSNRWNTVANNIQKLIEADELGEIVHVYSQSANPSLIRSPKPRFTWRTDAARTGTGILGDLGSHHVDLTHFLLGPIAEVCANLRTVIPEVYDDQGVAHPQLVDDDVVMLIRLARGAHGTLNASRLGSVHSNFPVGRRHYLIDGRKAGVLFENGQGWLFRPDQEPEPIPGDPPKVDAGHGAALQQGAIRQMQTFIQSVREDRDVAPTFRDGLLCQEVLHAAVESSRARAWRAVERVDG